MKSILKSLGAAALSAVALACGSGTPSTPTPAPKPAATPASSTTPPTDVLIRTRVTASESFVPLRGETALRDFVPDVRANETGGECQLYRTGGSGATIVTAFFPRRTGVQSQVTITFDSAGHLVRYSERRGIPHIAPGLTPDQLEAAVHSADAQLRSTTISMDYPVDQATAMNRGAGRPTVAVMSTVRAMESAAQLGPPATTLERVRKLCGV